MGSRFKVQGSRFASTALDVIRVVGCVAVIVGGIFYGILAECDLREFRFSDGWYRWQHDRALAEYYAEQENGKECTRYRISTYTH